ncbi:ricin-type beta-trefoil lectin domain protein [Streptomyces sp. TS71-3]|uniref:ricin-type beta-trefoil lectin domain protein n=1 Tax=Streptomyces sp. TS71-3 TaxID=2733862 RepID=UPI001B2310BC|nr:ricin-type beta-trefoil lectin domain protein [Streptomyces sp. TS71-3]GHJ37785.1 hypothetical protein Sm713_33940 [Streptomyces sp. TS71-3]
MTLAARRRRRLAPPTALASAVFLAAGLLGAVGGGTAAAAASEISNQGNGKCLDVTNGSTADGTPAQTWSCNGGPNQTWTQNSDGSLTALGKCLDVVNGGTGNGSAVHLWTCYGSVASQKWQYTSGHDLVNTASGKCLDIKDNNNADGARLQLWDCAGTANQKWNFPGAGDTTPPPSGDDPDLGPNVAIFDPSMSASTIQAKLNSVFAQQETNQFGSQRYALLFKPGTYNVDANVGFFTQVAGLGMSPDDVTINGAVHAEADWFDGNATQNFWREAENLSVRPSSGTDRWAVSQAAPYRRMHVKGNLVLDDGGWSSGGFISDTKVDGQINSGSQQQWLTRNSEIGSWTGSNWNQVFVGAKGAPAQSFPSPTYTTVGSAPKTREKPFLYVDDAGDYQVFVPAVQSNSSGTTWNGKTPAGSSLPLDQFYVVKPGASAATINAQLAAGKNLLFTPGVYHLSQTLNVTRPDTVVLGLGLATLVPDNGVTAISTADVDGIKLAGLLVDAGTTNSNLLVRIGQDGSSADHSADPTTLSDFFVRVGGAGVGKATQSVVINSDDVLADHLWLWRADHGSGVGWTSNTADNGLIVNGDDVTAYGLFVEHYQKTQVTWNGNGGRTYFFQNELPYDPPDQSAWMNGSTQGYPAYKVGAGVTSHEAWGLGSYAFFNANPSVVEAHSFEVPVTSGVRFHDLVTVSLGGTGTISHVINNTGAAANSSHQVTYLVTGP